AALETWPQIVVLALADANPHFLELARKLAPRSDAQFLGRDLLRDKLPPADLVIAGYVLAEIAAPALGGAIEKLFAAAQDVLVLIEPGTPAGFERLRAARTQLLAAGARVIGPCTHGAGCPIAAPDWCHFSQRQPRSRDHMRAKDASVPYEDERYAWLAVSGRRRSQFEGRSRVLVPPHDSKPGIEFKLCTPVGLDRSFVARRDKDVFARLRRARWGDVV
ncbi:MAG TPA: small ribosomal subunit Rsm22 family protein, partial [Rhizomicrobium sp.]